jgi:formamidopyrimidine-DNA glycosylase
MPELPDVELYLHALRPRIVGQTLDRVRIASPFLLRSVTPDVGSIQGQRVLALRRLGKRIVWALEEDLFVVIHLMIAGRFRWMPWQRKAEGGRTKAEGGGPKAALATFDFTSGTLTLTEASPKKRASLYVVCGEAALAEHDPGGLEVLTASSDDFAARLRLENRTLKRALTDPRLFSGIGNAYSDEILHAARLSPTQLTSNLSDDQTVHLFESIGSVLRTWATRLIDDTGDRFPEKVTAFREGMAVHGRYRQPCPRCGAPVQRIQYAANECNYCAPCQTGGRLLADRGLSRLLGKDWPRTLEELEELRRR